MRERIIFHILDTFLEF